VSFGAVCVRHAGQWACEGAGTHFIHRDDRRSGLICTRFKVYMPRKSFVHIWLKFWICTNKWTKPEFTVLVPLLEGKNRDTVLVSDEEHS